ncbi:kinase-like domain-containing protein [Mycena rebaudengoi]|nr:kinase-like domain-containing protein [Mycena rebaudengoi]
MQSMSNDLRIAQALVFSQLKDMKRIHEAFPFGKDASQKILNRFDALLHTTSGPDGDFSGRPHQIIIYSIFNDASAAYTELERMSSVAWIENHELIRRRFLQLLSPKKGHPYSMSPEEIHAWRYQVLDFSKEFIKNLKRKKRDPSQVYLKTTQICIDVVHALITDLRDNSEHAMFQEDSLLLTKICQRAELFPSSFTCKGTLEFPDDAVSDVGASATVRRGSVDATEVGVKSFRLYFRSMKSIRKRFIREALILQLLVHHPNVLRFISILNEPFNICIITPWYPHGHIMQYVARNPDAQLKELMEQVADGLHFVSEYGIIHGDLKGGNILIDENEKAVVADFGLSFIQENDEAEQISHVAPDPFAVAIIRAQCAEALRAGKLSDTPQSISTLAATVLSTASCSGGGTYRWMAPERLVPSAYNLPTAKATLASDVYSFAMVLVEVFSGEPPWGKHVPEPSVGIQVVTGLRPERPSNLPDGLWDLVQECWAQMPHDRPSIWDVYNRLACMP